MGAQGRLFEFVKLSKQIISNKKNIFNFKIIKQIIKILFNLSIIRYAVMYSYLRLKKNRIPSVLPDLNSKYFGIYHQIEQTPCYNSQIKLDKKKDILGQQLVKLNVRFNSIDFKTFLKSHEYLIKRIKMLRIGDLQKKYDKKILMQLFKNRINNFNSMAHHIGTTRMGS